jgi:hypothetical protein
MQGHGSRGGHGGGDPGHRGSGGLFIKKGAGGRPSKAAIAAKTAASDVKQLRISFGAALAPGGTLVFEGRIVLKAPSTFEEAAAVAGREHVVLQQKKSASSSTESVPDRLTQWAPRVAAGGGDDDGVGAALRPHLVDYSDSDDEDKGAAASSSFSSSSSSFSSSAATVAAKKRGCNRGGENDDDGGGSDELDASGLTVRRTRNLPELKAGVIKRARQRMPSATSVTFSRPWSSTSRASTPTATTTRTERKTRRCRRGFGAVQQFCETCAAKLFSGARNIGAYFRGLHCET